MFVKINSRKYEWRSKTMRVNKSQLIWGIVCLVIAAGLTVVNLTLPPDKLAFQIGGQNMPWVPPVVLGIIGIILLATMRQKEESETSSTQFRQGQDPETSSIQVKPGQDPQKIALNKRLESIAWGLFLIMLGGFALVPNSLIPRGVWSIGVGLIMLGLNAVRYFYNIKMSGFTTVLGILSLIGGVAELFGFTSLEGAFLLIILGAYLILKPWFEKRKLFGKAEEA
jgi:hypothetical protein